MKPHALCCLLLLWTLPAVARDTVHGGFHGLVRDRQTQEPLPGVVVTAVSLESQQAQRVVTDSRGLYRIGPLGPGSSGRYTLRFEKELYRTYARVDFRYAFPTRFELNVELASVYAVLLIDALYRIPSGPPATLEGTVTSVFTGRGLPFVDVSVYSTGLTRPVRVTTDAGGRFRFPLLHPDGYTLNFSGIVEPYTVPVTLRPGRTVRVRAVLREEVLQESSSRP